MLKIYWLHKSDQKIKQIFLLEVEGEFFVGSRDFQHSLCILAGSIYDRGGLIFLIQ